MLSLLNKTRALNQRNRSVTITFDNYKKLCYDKHINNGATHIRIDCGDCGEHDFRRMVYDVMNAEKFNSIYSLHINAPNSPIDGSLLDIVARKKRYVREFFVSGWTVYVPPKEMWTEFDNIRTFYLNLSDGTHVPDASSRVVEGIRASELIILENTSPFYPELDIGTFDKCLPTTNIILDGYYINKKPRENIKYKNCRVGAASDHLHVVDV